MSKPKAIQPYISELCDSLPPADSFAAVGDLTALRRRPTGEYVRTNYERGMLLYALVSAKRPRTVVEIGTGRGYGAMCAAWAMSDHGIDGRVYTIDVLGPQATIRWAIDRHDGSGPNVEMLSRRSAWHGLPSDWTRRIIQLTGFATRVTASLGDDIDLAFIDGDHSRAAVAADFAAVLGGCAQELTVLFDDYSTHYGVKPFVDAELAPSFSIDLVRTDRQIIDRDDPPVDNAMAVLHLAEDDMARACARWSPSRRRAIILRQEVAQAVSSRIQAARRRASLLRKGSKAGA